MAKATTAASEVVEALTSFVGVTKGDKFYADDPIVRKWPEFFGPLQVRRSAEDPRIEQATAAPGEKRGG